LFPAIGEGIGVERGIVIVAPALTMGALLPVLVCTAHSSPRSVVNATISSKLFT
jgi:hypothetical protein